VAAAAVVLAAGLGLGNIAWDNRQAADEARLQAARITEIVTDPSRTEAAAQVAGGGVATVVAADGEAVFAARGLTPPERDKTYQLWVLRGDQIRSAGVLDVEDGATRAWVADVEPGSSLAVSVEPEGGSDQPTTDPVVNVPVA
jgi:anti-sigma-K factor RskA